MDKLQHYINGEWIDSSSERGHAVINPATGETLCEVPFATKNEVQQAVTAAHQAFEGWRQVPVLSRVRYLFELKNILEDRFEELARTVTREHGKVLDEARGEVRRGIENIEVAAGMPSLSMGYHQYNVASGIDEYVARVPLGVFAIVPPYNFPLMVPLWFLPYALATGNTVIVKPSEQVPGAQQLVFEALDDIGLPSGVVNLVHGDKEAVMDLLEASEVRGISFVGSSPVAKALYSAAAVRGKRAQCQGGAKNYILLMDDMDIRKSVPSLIASCYGCTGQRCLAGSVMLVHERIYESFKEAFIEAAENLTIGDGMDESVQLGPLISQRHLTRVLDYIGQGEQEGARLLLDGRKVKVSSLPRGHFLGATIFETDRLDLKIVSEEIFGPVVVFMKISSLQAAIKTINASPFGNAAAIYTASGLAARTFKSEVHCGNIGVNIGVPAPMAMFPFGGMKQSFYGDLHGQGPDVIDFYTDRKVSIERWI